MTDPQVTGANSSHSESAGDRSVGGYSRGQLSEPEQHSLHPDSGNLGFYTTGGVLKQCSAMGQEPNDTQI